MSRMGDRGVWVLLGTVPSYSSACACHWKPPDWMRFPKKWVCNQIRRFRATSSGSSVMGRLGRGRNSRRVRRMASEVRGKPAESNAHEASWTGLGKTLVIMKKACCGSWRNQPENWPWGYHRNGHWGPWEKQLSWGCGSKNWSVFHRNGDMGVRGSLGNVASTLVWSYID